MSNLIFFSAIYLISASVSLSMGLYTLHLAPKQLMNRVFFLMCVCLTIWALGYSVVIVAPDEDTAIVWTRIAAVGYELIYSLLLHFILLLTGVSEKIKTKLVYVLLYLPAAVCLYAFSLSSSVAQDIYEFEYTARGWIRSTPPNGFDHLFVAYYGGTVLISLLLLWRWKRKSQKVQTGIQSNLLIVSFAVAFGVGTFTDMLNGNAIEFHFPSAAPMLFLIPLAAILYCIRRYHLLHTNHMTQMELILGDDGRRTILHIVPYGLLPGGILLYLVKSFWWESETSILTTISTMVLIALGVFAILVRRFRGGYVYLEGLLIIASMILTPLLTVDMHAVGGSIVWTFPILLIFCSLLFNSVDVLIASVVPALLGQIYLVATLRQEMVENDYRTYVSREILLLLVAAMGYLIHRIYVRRLKENAMQTKTQMLINEVTARFTLAEGGHGQAVSDLLAKLADYYMAETVILYTEDKSFADLIGNNYYSLSNQAEEGPLTELVKERWGDWLLERAEGKTDLPVELALSMPQHSEIREKPWLFMPIFEGGRTLAYIYIESSNASSIWTREHFVPLPILSRLVSTALETRFMAYYDTLTKLPNRRLFYDRVTQAIHLAKRNGWQLGVAFLDMDSFKAINDSMGHENGDLLIQSVSQKLKDSLRRSDTVGRFGGDEFLILMNHVEKKQTGISKVADKLLELFEEPIIIHGQEIYVTASCGIAMYPEDGEDAETLIKHADIAMYSAKEKGKNQYAYCSDRMKQAVEYRAVLSKSMYRALERGEFQIHYQPQIELQSERIVGFEALLRWMHPEYGLVPPGEFIAIAEQTGLINPIGNWVLETACMQLMHWKERGFGELRMAVNLSVVQLRNPMLVTQIKQILQRTGVTPELIELEITESATMKEPDYIIGVLDELKSLGVSISIDDFGTEYSSLNRLKLLPIDRLKMDMQFVQGIDHNPKDRAILMVIMGLAQNLGLKLVAEGVESITQLDFLKDRMCDEAQGYYYYKPMPGAEMELILSR